MLAAMAKSGKKISQLLRDIPNYEMVKTKISCSKEKADRMLKDIKRRFKRENINLVDGIKIDWPEGWVHIRPSNTEPVVRIIAEAQTKNEARELIDRIFRKRGIK